MEGEARRQAGQLPPCPGALQLAAGQEMAMPRGHPSWALAPLWPGTGACQADAGRIRHPKAGLCPPCSGTERSARARPFLLRKERKWVWLESRALGRCVYSSSAVAPQRGQELPVEGRVLSSVSRGCLGGMSQTYQKEKKKKKIKKKEPKFPFPGHSARGCCPPVGEGLWGAATMGMQPCHGSSLAFGASSPWVQPCCGFHLTVGAALPHHSSGWPMTGDPPPPGSAQDLARGPGA